MQKSRPDRGRAALQTPAGMPVTEIVFVVEEAAEGGYTARAVGASIFTEADTLETLRNSVREAVACHFAEGHPPRMIRLHFVHDEILTP